MRHRFLGLAFTPSFQISNLCSSSSEDARSVCYVHDTDVICMELDCEMNVPRVLSQSKVDTCGKCQVHQAAYINIGKMVCLGIASDSGFQLWSSTGDRMIWFISIEAIISANMLSGMQTDLQFQYVRGIASIPVFQSVNEHNDVQEAHVCVGSSLGGVCVYSSKGVLQQCLTLKAALGDAGAGSITSLSGSDAYLVAADEFGNISAFSVAENYRKVMQAQTQCVSYGDGGNYCTVVCCKDSMAFAGFLNGLLRVYNLAAGSLVMEVAAHSRCITGLSLHPSDNYLVSCGEDQAVNVWTLPSPSNGSYRSNLDLAHSEHWVDSVCTGVTWWRSSYVLCVGYDSNNMLVASHRTRSSMRPDEFRSMKEVSQLLHKASTQASDMK